MPTPSSEAIPSESAAQQPAFTTTEAFQEGDYWFRATVQEVRDQRANDGPLVISMRVEEHLGGEAVEAGDWLSVVQSYGFSPYRCLGQVYSEGRPGTEVFVHAHEDERGVADLATCDDERYFVLLTPEEAASTPPPPTCPADHPDCMEVIQVELWPPAHPTCSPEIDCGVDFRTVTVDLWSCEGGPCASGNDADCQRLVSLQVGDKSWEPDPFFCLVQFHRVPVGDYLLTVSQGVECGPLCDGIELCQVIASANRIAIEPVADGECPSHVLS